MWCVRDTLDMMSASECEFGEEIAIEEVEVGAFCMCAVAWAWGNATTIISPIWTDNRHVFDWISKGKARSRRSRRILIRLLFWRIVKGLRIYVFSRGVGAT